MRIFDRVQVPNLTTAGILCLDTNRYMLYAFGKVYGHSVPSCRRPSGALLGDLWSVKNIFSAGDFRGGIFFERIFKIRESLEKILGTQLWYEKFFCGRILTLKIFLTKFLGVWKIFEKVLVREISGKI